MVDAALVAVDWTLGLAMGTARFWWIAVGYLCGLFAWYAVQVHQTKYLVEIGFSPTDAAWALGLVSLAGIPGQIVLGHLSDRIGREWVWTVGNLGFALCYLVLLLLREAPTPALLYLMVAAQGVLGYGLTSVVGAILAEAALSYLGLGAAEPTPSWGLMLSGSALSYAEKAPWIAIFPSVAISLGVFGFNLFGDSLRDALDPKLRGR